MKFCKYCKKEFSVKRNNKIFCSKTCYIYFQQENQELNCVCEICGLRFHKKPSQILRAKNHYCSKECLYIGKQTTMKGSDNHQYGLKGDKNSSWKSDERISYYGYKLIRVLNHPFRNEDDFVFEHRLVAEQYLLNEENSIEINSKRYLSKDYAVHHKDFNRLNNNVENLEVMTIGEHITLHNQLMNRERNVLGQFI